MKKILKRNYKDMIFGVIVGALVSGIGVYAATNILATNVTYTPSDSSWNVNNTASALDNLYDYYETSKYVNQKDCVQGTFTCTDCTTSTGQKILDFAPDIFWIKLSDDKRIIYYDKNIYSNDIHILYLEDQYEYNQNGNNYNKYESFPITNYFKINDNLVFYNASTFYQNQEMYFMACK